MNTKIQRQIQSFFGGIRALKCLENWTFVEIVGNGSGGIVYLIKKDDEVRVKKRTSKIDVLK